MTVPPASSSWSIDLDGLHERLAERLRAGGAPHPEPAAAALAARGRRRLGRCDLAHDLGLTDDLLAAIEAGELPVDQWPAALASLVVDERGCVTPPAG